MINLNMKYNNPLKYNKNQHELKMTLKRVLQIICKRVKKILGIQNNIKYQR